MKKFLVILVICCLSQVVAAQNRRMVVKGFSKAEIGDIRARASKVLDNNQKLTALVEVSLPVADTSVVFDGIIGSPVKSVGNWLIRVAEGTLDIRIAIPACETLTFAFPEVIESGRVYKLQLSVQESQKLRSLIMPVFSYNSSQLSYGLMLGICKSYLGGYIKAKTNFEFGIEPTLECNSDGYINGVKGWFSGESAKSRYSITGGYLGQLFQTKKNAALYAYAGAGYGQRLLAWQVRGTDGEYEYAKVSPVSYSGVEAELGLIFRAGSFAVMAGVQTLQFKYIEANVGIGVMF